MLPLLEGRVVGRGGRLGFAALLTVFCWTAAPPPAPQRPCFDTLEGGRHQAGELPKTHQNRSQNHQKSSQNRPLESLWDPLATLLEPRAPYVPFMYPIWFHFGPQMGPQNRSKIDHCLDLCLTSFLGPLFHAFGLHLGSQNDPKMKLKRVPTRNQKIIDFATIYYTCATLRGPGNHHF